MTESELAADRAFISQTVNVIGIKSDQLEEIEHYEDTIEDLFNSNIKKMCHYNDCNNGNKRCLAIMLSY